MAWQEAEPVDIDAAYEQALSLGLVDEAWFDRLTDSIATSILTISGARKELECVLAAAAARSTTSILALPQELIPILCLSLSERDVFASLGATCRAMAATIGSRDFLKARLASMPLTDTHVRTLGAAAQPYMVGCMIIPRDHWSSCDRLSRLQGALATAHEYLQSGGLDVSHGKERYPVTVRTQLPEDQTGTRRLYGEAPFNYGYSFTYDAGPLTAPVPLQIFRCGVHGGLGYGLCTLAAVATDSLVTTYWGEYTFGVPGSGGRLQRMYTRKSGKTERKNYALQVHHEGRVFWIDPLRIGNAAKYVNHSPARANVELRYVKDDSPIEAGSLGLITGLQFREDLNGRLATVLSWDQSCGRWACRLRPWQEYTTAAASSAEPGGGTAPSEMPQPSGAVHVVRLRPCHVARIALAPPFESLAGVARRGLPAEFTCGPPLVGLYATRPIEPGEEVLLDYTFATTYVPMGQREGDQSMVGKMSAFKHAPQMGGFEAYEMLREVGSNRRLAALWEVSTEEVQHGHSFNTRRETIQRLLLAEEDDNNLNLPLHPIPQEEDSSWEWIDFEQEIRSDEEDPEEGQEWYRTKLNFWPAHAVYG